VSEIQKLKNYANYEDYVNHQKEKTLDPVRRKKWIEDEWLMKIEMFTEIFKRHSDIVKGKALCVCARMGHEVSVLQSLGVDAIGMDLVPHLPLVEEGDMHNLKYDDNTFDFVFSNSFDHSLEPDKMISEIERVLKPGGHALLQFQFNVADNYAETKLKDINPVINLISSSEVVLNAKIPPSKCPTYHWEVVFKHVG
jgi:SAM-dependent methyltransferase